MMFWGLPGAFWGPLQEIQAAIRPLILDRCKLTSGWALLAVLRASWEALGALAGLKHASSYLYHIESGPLLNNHRWKHF